jgi:MtrB/PioB family decaheme-associated outer membrane protein
MSQRWIASFALMVACGASAVFAQTGQVPSVPAQPVEPGIRTVANRIDFGMRLGSVTGDAARWQRYRDLRDGPTINRFDWRRENDTWWLAASADHIGYRDQRYQFEFARPGRVQARLMWDQIPLFISQDTRTLYSETSPGTLRVDNTIQAGIQGGAFTLREAAATAFGVTTRTRRDVALGEVRFRATPDTDVFMTVNSQDRQGNIPYGATFGFGNTVELPMPIDSRTTNVTTGLEWANRTAMVRLSWDGSFYNNDVQTVLWDNPIRITDSPTAGPAEGRMALWPSNRFNTLSSAASMRLPGRSRVTGSLALGWMHQNEPLLPHTTNQLLPTVPLPRGTADVSGRTTASYLAFTSRPTPRLLFSARHRYYEFDNTTPAFNRTGYVSYDTAVRAGGGTPELFSLSRNTLDVDATTTFGAAAFKVGYGLQGGDRTNRHFTGTTEHTFRTAVDLTGSNPVTVRAQYERARRAGRELDLHPLQAANEQITMRQFDIANRTRDRATVIAFYAPVARIDLQASIAGGKDDYTEQGIGLRDNTHFIYSAGVNVSPTDAITAGLSYSFEEYDAFLNQNQATTLAQTFDPTRRWDVDTDDRAHNLLADLVFPRLFPRTDVRLNYDYSRARVTFLYSLPPGSTLPQPAQLPPVKHSDHRSQVGLVHHLTARFGIGLDYWYDRYDVQDFALGGEIDQGIAFPIIEPGQTATVNTVLLNYLYRPFRGHTSFLRAIYSF